MSKIKKVPKTVKKQLDNFLDKNPEISKSYEDRGRLEGDSLLAFLKNN